MSLILNNKIPSLMKGYPTVSDKYDVRGATLSADSTDGHFGDVIVYNGDGFFNVATAITKSSDVAGVLLATNVKLITDFFNGSSMNVVTKAGEAFNLMTKGFVALEVKTGTDLSTLKEGLQVGLTADGKLVLSTTTSAIAMSNWYFTGVTETLDDGTLLAEVEIR